jgi:hypothetical protein
MSLIATATCASSSAKDLARAGKKVRLVHKRPEGEVAAAGALQGHSSPALALSQSNRFVNKPSHSP